MGNMVHLFFNILAQLCHKFEQIKNFPQQGVGAGCAANIAVDIIFKKKYNMSFYIHFSPISLIT